MLRAGTMFVHDIINRKSIDDAVINGVKHLVSNNKKKQRYEQSTILKKQRKGKQDIFFIMTEGLTDALNLFLTPPIQTSVIKGTWVQVRPTDSVRTTSPLILKFQVGEQNSLT